MFKLHLISELKEALITLKDKTPAIPKPVKCARPLPSPRQKMVLHEKNCFGCGACATVCPAHAISLAENKKYKTVIINLANCIYCGLCIEACPENALSLGAGCDLASPAKDHLHHELRIRLSRCKQCRAITGTGRGITKVARDGYLNRGITAKELEWIELCAVCKRKFHSLRLSRQTAR